MSCLHGNHLQRRRKSCNQVLNWSTLLLCGMELLHLWHHMAVTWSEATWYISIFWGHPNCCLIKLSFLLGGTNDLIDSPSPLRREAAVTILMAAKTSGLIATLDLPIHTNWFLSVWSFHRYDGSSRRYLARLMTGWGSSLLPYDWLIQVAGSGDECITVFISMDMEFLRFLFSLQLTHTLTHSQTHTHTHMCSPTVEAAPAGSHFGEVFPHLLWLHNKSIFRISIGSNNKVLLYCCQLSWSGNNNLLLLGSLKTVAQALVLIGGPEIWLWTSIVPSCPLQVRAVRMCR